MGLNENIESQYIWLGTLVWDCWDPWGWCMHSISLIHFCSGQNGKFSSDARRRYIRRDCWSNRLGSFDSAWLSPFVLDWEGRPQQIVLLFH